MLVLTRRIGESIYIGEDIKVVILQVCGQYVKVGIRAPRSTIILRHEIYERQNLLQKELAIEPKKF